MLDVSFWMYSVESIVPSVWEVDHTNASGVHKTDGSSWRLVPLGLDIDCQEL